MKYVYSFALLLLLTTMAQAQDVHDLEKPKFLIDTLQLAKADTMTPEAMLGFSTELDKRHGFLGVRFDRPLSSFTDLQFNRNSDSDVVYRKKAERKAVGEATIKYIDYYFYKGKLAAIQVRATNSLQNEKAWMELLKAAYQVEPSAVISESDYSPGGSYLWRGDHTDVNYSAYRGNDLSIYISCADVRTVKARDKALRLKQAADKL